MRALNWFQLLQQYARDHGKRVFTLTELANLSGADPHVLRVTLHRLQHQGVVQRLAQGLYGPAAVAAADLVPYLDSCAYITGFAALYHHGHIDQVPTSYTCFTNRRHATRRRWTVAGTFELVTVNEPIYSFPEGREVAIAPPEQAFLDYVYRCRIEGVSARGLTLRRLHELRGDVIERLGSRYPCTVRDYATAILTNRPRVWDTRRPQRLRMATPTTT